MRFLLICLFGTMLLIYYPIKNQHTLSENFWVIGYDGGGHEIDLDQEMCMNAPKVKFLLFVYHDSIFTIEMEQGYKQRFCFLKCTNQSKDSLMSLLEPYQKTTLKKQLNAIKEHGIPHGCFTDGYHLFNLNDHMQFGLFDFTSYYYWRCHYPSKKIKLQPRQVPKVYEKIYHAFNSERWDYYMSNEYHYKGIRVHYSR